MKKLFLLLIFFCGNGCIVASESPKKSKIEQQNDKIAQLDSRRKIVVYLKGTADDGRSSVARIILTGIDPEEERPRAKL